MINRTDSIQLSYLPRCSEEKQNLQTLKQFRSFFLNKHVVYIVNPLETDTFYDSELLKKFKDMFPCYWKSVDQEQLAVWNLVSTNHPPLPSLYKELNVLSGT